MTTITLSGGVLTPPLSALYSRLIRCADALGTALTLIGAESKLEARMAYEDLRATGALLGRSKPATASAMTDQTGSTKDAKA